MERREGKPMERRHIRRSEASGDIHGEETRYQPFDLACPRLIIYGTKVINVHGTIIAQSVRRAVSYV